MLQLRKVIDFWAAEVGRWWPPAGFGKRG